MPELVVRAVRWVADDPQPGLVECRLVDVDGVQHMLIDKSSIFDAADRLRSDAAYPIEVTVTCSIVRAGDADVVIELAHHIESVDGQSTFRVSRSSLRF
jgi:hypothetical protein